MMISRRNNFDLIRLLAATQVVLIHAIEHLDITLTGIEQQLIDFAELFPGVPIFFVISGFLISLSYERHPKIKAYAVNRILRVFPALWICFFFSILTVISTGYLFGRDIPPGQLIQWIVNQLTIAQFYNPQFMREYGVGNLNGSLWTIPIEIQFYLVLPLIYIMIKRVKILSYNVVFWVLMLFFLYINILLLPHVDAITIVFVRSVIPYMFMFLTGVLIQRHFTRLQPYLENKALYWLIFYISSSYFLNSVFGLTITANNLNQISFFILAFTTISFSFTARGLSEALLKGNDISYGIYIYHMIIINIFVELYITGTRSILIFVFIATYILAFLSWKIIEKPALAFKYRSPKTTHLPVSAGD